MTAMVNTTRPTPLPGDSLLEKFPPELLENILLKVIVDVVPPYMLDEKEMVVFGRAQDICSDFATEPGCL
jgi:hypothetical protein